MDLFLGFDFYGSGNIGDDLMVAGFLKACAGYEVKLTCVLPRRVGPQRLRFPEVHWEQAGQDTREQLISRCEAWIGVGDTPFSVRQGTWLLEHTMSDARVCQRYSKPMHMIGVGAEGELLTSNHRKMVREVVELLGLIVTRDEASSRILRQVAPLKAGKIMTGVDLATKYLASRSFRRPARGSTNLGVCYWDEEYDGRDRAFLRKMIRGLRQRDYEVEFFANETRGGFERKVYRDVLGPWPWMIGRNEVPFVRPEYEESADVAQLIAHYQRYDVVITSRYHALLTAAWTGARCIGIGRRSKVAALAKDLQIPFIRVPGDTRRVLDAVEHCQPIDNSKLAVLSARVSVLEDAVAKMVISA